MSEFLETTVDKFVFKVATDRLYSRAGVWVLDEGQGRLRLGVTDYQQQLNGDVAFVHVKPAGTRLAVGDELAEMETIKATISFASPAAGKLAEVNADLDPRPEIVNEDPYGKGWLVLIEAANWSADRATLLDAPAYLSAIRVQAEKEAARP